MANAVFILDVTEDGVVATHPGRVELPVLVAPVPDETKAKFLNTIRPQLVAIGCMNLSDRGFDFDSSFVAPRSKSRFVAFGGMMTHLSRHDPSGAGRFPPVAIFGHADPTGDPEYNKTLSGRRARAVLGILTRDAALWERLFSDPFGGDVWGMKSIQTMLSFVGGIPFYDGPIDGAKTPETRKQTEEAIKAYKEARGIKPPDGSNTAAFRKVLFLEYMDEICRLPNGGPPYRLDKKEGFLARNKDAGRKGDVMGCGEFNPLLLLSQQEDDAFKTAATDPAVKEARNDAYAEDRRVLVFAFKHDSEIDPAKWPCPRATESTGGCRQRFWADDKERLRREPEERREFKKTTDTMACRFYHAFARHSPCETGARLWVVRLRRDGSKDKPDPFKNRAYVVQAGDTAQAPVLRGFTDDDGRVVIPALHESMRMTLKLDVFGLETPPADDDAQPAPTEGTPEAADTDAFANEDKFVQMPLDGGALESMTAATLPAEQRLFNLGLGTSAPGTMSDDERRRAVRGFQRIHGLEVPGEHDDKTRALRKTEHEGGPPPA